MDENSTLYIYLKGYIAYGIHIHTTVLATIRKQQLQGIHKQVINQLKLVSMVHYILTSKGYGLV